MSGDGQVMHAWVSDLLSEAQADLLSGMISGIADLAVLTTLDGKVLDVRTKPTLAIGADLSAWVGNRVQDHVTSESLSKINRCLDLLRQGATSAPLTEVNHKSVGEGGELPVAYSFHLLSVDGNCLMLGRDLRPLAEMQQQLISAQIALEKDYEQQRTIETRLRVLMNTLPQACLFIDVPQRVVRDANTATGALFARDLNAITGFGISGLLEMDGPGDTLDQLVEAAGGAPGARVTARVRSTGGEVEVSPVSFRTGGVHMLLCQVERKATGAGTGSPLEERLAGLYAKSPDAIAFVGDDGNILSVNGSFLDLADIAIEQDVRGRPLADFLNRGGVDVSILLENADRSGVLRLFATKIVGAHGGARPVEVSITRLTAGTTTMFALVLRDTSRIDAVRAKPPKGSVDMGSVTDLIGKQSLKDIVARTTDVIEKMCIEAAVELTSNNRVAAADMLGLSRQSLYVKLRKYDLLKRGGE